jgi:hypothetical protein
MKPIKYIVAALLALGAAQLTQTVFSAEQTPAAVDESGDPSPFPPGPNAMLVKQTCSKCHSPNVVVTQTFNEKTARKVYQKMIGESPDTEQGKKIVTYLYTVLGEKSE